MNVRRLYSDTGKDLINGSREERNMIMTTQKKGEDEERKEDGDGNDY
jgi:hypothetical protein